MEKWEDDQRHKNFYLLVLKAKKLRTIKKGKYACQNKVVLMIILAESLSYQKNFNAFYLCSIATILSNTCAIPSWSRGLFLYIPGFILKLIKYLYHHFLPYKHYKNNATIIQFQSIASLLIYWINENLPKDWFFKFVIYYANVFLPVNSYQSTSSNINKDSRRET